MGSEVEVLRFGVLGPLEVLRDGDPVRIGGQRQRALLALLLVHANELVRIDQLLEALSGERRRRPGSTRCVSRSRGCARCFGAARTARCCEHTQVVTCWRSALRSLIWRGLSVCCARRADSIAADQPATAAALLRDALALWRGPPLADLARVDYFQDEIRRLEQLRLLALMEHIDVDLALGGGAELIPEIESLVASDPLQERLRAQLMLALYRAGRQADALATYRQTSALLRVELGLEPSRALQRLEQSILKRDPSLEPVRVPAAGSDGRTALSSPTRSSSVKSRARSQKNPGVDGRGFSVRAERDP